MTDLEIARRLRHYLNPQWEDEREEESWNDLLKRNDPLISFYVGAATLVMELSTEE